MIDNYLNTCLSRYDLKVLANETTNNTSKKLEPFTLAEIKQLLKQEGYKLVSKQYYNSNNKKCMTYYIITDE